MVALTYDFLVNNLFGSIWMAIGGTAFIYILIGVLGRMGSFLILSLLGLYISVMFILFLGIWGWAFLNILANSKAEKSRRNIPADGEACFISAIKEILPFLSIAFLKDTGLGAFFIKDKKASRFFLKTLIFFFFVSKISESILCIFLYAFIDSRF